MRSRSQRAELRIPLTIFVTLVVALVATASPASAADRWTDISDATWVSVYGVTAEQVGGVADGYPDGTFQPYKAVTRGQFTKMAVNGLGVETLDPLVPSFTDVPPSYTFFVHIEGAAEAGLVGGYSDGSFRPGQLVSRQQSNTILARYLAGAEFSTSGFIRGEVRTYPSLASWFEAEGNFYLFGYDDHSAVLDAHRAGTAYLIYREIVLGSGGKLNPAGSLTRAQAATLVLRTAAMLSEITTPPPAPTGLFTLPASPSRDDRPYVNGKTIPGGNVAIYDSFAGGTTEIVQVMADSTGNFSARVPVLLEGAHSFTAKVKDELGLVSAASTSVAYVLDLSEPTGFILSPTTGSAVRSRKPSFTASSTDTGSGVASVAFQYRPAGSIGAFITISTNSAPAAGIYEAFWGDVSLPDGAYDFRVVVVDAAQNQRVLGPISVIVDLQSPTVELLAPISDGIVFTAERTPLFAAAAADPPPSATPTTVTSGVARVDFLYALRSALPAQQSSWTAAAFTLLGSDDSPGYSADWGTTSLADGDYIFAVQSFDKAGNSSALDWQRVVVDNLPPVVSVTAPLAGAKLKGGTSYNITWTATDTYMPANPIQIEYSADGGTTWTTLIAATENDGAYTWTVPTVTVGAAKIRVTATDALARTSGAVSGAFTIDSTAPEAPTGVAVTDVDATPGLDGRDFSATWTVSVATDVVRQHVYILPVSTVLVLSGDGAHTPLATIPNNTTATWQGTSAMLVDSAGVAFDPLKAYQVWIVAEDAVGHLSPSAPAVWPPPAAPTGVTASDADTTNTGLDGRDFSVDWTRSVSVDVLSHRIYILPSAITLVLTGVHTPVATVTDDTVPWVGPASLTTDSAGTALAEVEYTVYVVATDDEGRTAIASATMTPTSD